MSAHTMIEDAKQSATDDDRPRLDVRELVRDLGGASGDAFAQVRDSAADVAGTIVERAPAALSQETIEQIAMHLRASSSDSLVLGTVFSMGLWSGLALARAPRPLMLLAIVPALLLGGTLLSRRTPSTQRSSGARR